MVEAILFASARPMTLREIGQRLPAGCDAGEALRLLRARYEGRGVHLARVGDAWAFRTAADLAFLMQEEAVETRRLSRAATETLLREQAAVPSGGYTITRASGSG